MNIEIIDDFKVRINKWYLLLFCILTFAMPITIMIMNRISNRQAAFQIFCGLIIFNIFFSVMLIIPFHFFLRRNEKLIQIQNGARLDSKFSMLLMKFLALCFFVPSTVIFTLHKVDQLMQTFFPDPEQNSRRQHDFIIEMITSGTAGIEELWRLSTFVLLIILFNKTLPSSKYKSVFNMLITIIISSLVFGWMHTFGYEKHGYFSIPLTLSLGASGIILALFLLLTRNIFVCYFSHSLFDILATLSNMKKISYIALWNDDLLIMSGSAFLVLSIYLMNYKQFESNIFVSTKSNHVSELFK